MNETILIESDRLAAVVAPHLGGSLLSLDWREGAVPVMRTTPGAPERANERAMFVMVPWCNRISGPGLPWEGRVYPLPRLIPEQTLAIHGIMLHRALAVVEREAGMVRLALSADDLAPFHFDAELLYRLDGGTLEATVTLRHTGAAPAPYGVGFHPWFERGPDDLLSFSAERWVEENDARLPSGRLPAMVGSALDYSAPRPLPEGLINNTFLGWDGTARLDRADGMRLTLTGGGATGRILHVYSRARECGFVCLEAQSHTVDCVNTPVVEDAGLVPLAAGEMLVARMSVTAERAE